MADDERLRRVENWQAGAAVEIDHLKEAVVKTNDTLGAHALHDSEARAELWRAQRRFMWWMFGLLLTALAGQYIAR